MSREQHFYGSVNFEDLIKHYENNMKHEDGLAASGASLK